MNEMSSSGGGDLLMAPAKSSSSPPTPAARYFPIPTSILYTYLLIYVY